MQLAHQNLHYQPRQLKVDDWMAVLKPYEVAVDHLWVLEVMAEMVVGGLELLYSAKVIT